MNGDDARSVGGERRLRNVLRERENESVADHRVCGDVEAQLVDEQQRICLLTDSVLQREHTMRAPLRTSSSSRLRRRPSMRGPYSCMPGKRLK